MCVHVGFLISIQWILLFIYLLLNKGIVTLSDSRMWKRRALVEAAFSALGTAACVTLTCWTAASVVSEPNRKGNVCFELSSEHQSRSLAIWCGFAEHENKEESHLYAGTKHILFWETFIILFKHGPKDTLIFYFLLPTNTLVRQPEGFVGCLFLNWNASSCPVSSCRGVLTPPAHFFWMSPHSFSTMSVFYTH